MSGVEPVLCPVPRSFTPGGDVWSAGTEFEAAFENVPHEDQRRLQAAVDRLMRERKAEDPHTPAPGSVTVTLSVNLESPPTEAHTLDLRPGVIWIESGTAAGLFRGLQTLRQLLRMPGGRVPAGRIRDVPAFAERGYLLDISRDKVPTMATLFALADLLAELKFNRFELYTEHTFAYRDHPEVWEGASPMTPEDIQTLDAFCRDRYLDLVPNQNSFGHMERWLKHPRYHDLAECPHGCVSPWGPERRPPAMLNPCDPRSLELIAGLYDDLLPNFTSVKLNAGCDETYELGQGRSHEACARLGRGRVYLDYLLRIDALARQHGRTLHYWADVVHEHPELIPELPRDAVALEWGYEAGHDFAARLAPFRAAGLRVFVCPGTSTWNSVAGRTANALANLRTAAAAGQEAGAAGYLVTDWGDNGHWQPLPTSYVPLAAASVCAWSGAAAATWLEPILSAADRHLFRDPSGHAARAFAELGNVYLATGMPVPNATLLFKLLAPQPEARWIERAREVDWEAVESAIEGAARRWTSAVVRRADADLLRDEFAFAAGLLRLACRRGRGEGGAATAALALRLAGDHRRIWLARNRAGGLADSLARLDALAAALGPAT